MDILIFIRIMTNCLSALHSGLEIKLHHPREAVLCVRLSKMSEISKVPYKGYKADKSRLPS